MGTAALAAGWLGAPLHFADHGLVALGIALTGTLLTAAAALTPRSQVLAPVWRETALLSGLPLACGIVSCLLGGVLSDWLIRRFGSRKWGRRLVGCTALALAGGATLLPIWADEDRIH